MNSVDSILNTNAEKEWLCPLFMQENNHHVCSTNRYLLAEVKYSHLSICESKTGAQENTSTSNPS